jgi:hypothetical protein
MLTHLKIWLNHFEYHSEHPRRVPEGISDVLTEAERRLIAASISTFQLGEHSSGSHPLRAAYSFAGKQDAPEVARIMELLIREEQQHATLLRTFMTAHGIALREHHWTDSAFRRIRRLGGMEWALTVLLTAELIGTVYYRALERATGCQRLRLLCRMIVADELAHVGFESDLLLFMRSRRPAAVRLCIDAAHGIFLMGSALVLWATHRRVLGQAGSGLWGFVRACRLQYRFYLQPPPRIESSSPLTRGSKPPASR